MKIKLENILLKSFLKLQGLGLGTFTAVALGSISGQGNKIPQAMWHKQNEMLFSPRLKNKFYHKLVNLQL